MSEGIPSNFTVELDPQERIDSFQFSKLPCGQNIFDMTKLHDFCKDKNSADILNTSFENIKKKIKTEGEEETFFLYIQWSGLQSILAQYEGRDEKEFDKDRCIIEHISQHDQKTIIKGILLPPKAL